MGKDIFNYSPTVNIAGQTPSLKKWKLDYYGGMSFLFFIFLFFVFVFYLFISWSIVGFAFQLLPVLTKLHDIISIVFDSIIFPCSFLVFGKHFSVRQIPTLDAPSILCLLIFLDVFFLISCLLTPPLPPLFSFLSSKC